MSGILLNRSRQVPAEETPAFGGIAERFRRAGDLDRAIALCRDGLKRFPQQLSARVTLGWALLDKGQYDEARAELEQVLRRAPDNLAAIRGLAELHERAENAPETPSSWQQAAEAAEAASPTPADTPVAAPHAAAKPVAAAKPPTATSNPTFSPEALHAVATSSPPGWGPEFQTSAAAAAAAAFAGSEQPHQAPSAFAIVSPAQQAMEQSLPNEGWTDLEPATSLAASQAPPRHADPVVQFSTGADIIFGDVEDSPTDALGDALSTEALATDALIASLTLEPASQPSALTDLAPEIVNETAAPAFLDSLDFEAAVDRTAGHPGTDVHTEEPTPATAQQLTADLLMPELVSPAARASDDVALDLSAGIATAENVAPEILTLDADANSDMAHLQLAMKDVVDDEALTIDTEELGLDEEMPAADDPRAGVAAWVTNSALALQDSWTESGQPLAGGTVIPGAITAFEDERDEHIAAAAAEVDAIDAAGGLDTILEFPLVNESFEVDSVALGVDGGIDVTQSQPFELTADAFVASSEEGSAEATSLLTFVSDDAIDVEQESLVLAFDAEPAPAAWLASDSHDITSSDAPLEGLQPLSNVPPVAGLDAFVSELSFGDVQAPPAMDAAMAPDAAVASATPITFDGSPALSAPVVLDTPLEDAAPIALDAPLSFDTPLAFDSPIHDPAHILKMVPTLRTERDRRRAALPALERFLRQVETRRLQLLTESVA